MSENRVSQAVRERIVAEGFCKTIILCAPGKTTEVKGLLNLHNAYIVDISDGLPVINAVVRDTETANALEASKDVVSVIEDQPIHLID